MIAPDGYEIGDALGRDSTGTLYHAIQTRLNRPVTLKVLREEYGRNARARRLFEEERDLVTRLEHPHVLLTLDVGETDDLPWFVTESTVEPRLHAALKPGAPLDELRAVHLALGLARALAYLAGRGLVYKNLRPQNVLLPRPSAPKLLTFRNVRKASEAASFQGASVQSGHYCAPELTRSDLGPPDVRANVYALGAIFYQLLTGAPPADGSSAEARARHAAGELVPLRERRPYIRDRAVRVVGRMLAHDPAARAFPDQAVQLLQDYAEDPLVRNPLKKARKKRRRR